MDPEVQPFTDGVFVNSDTDRSF